MIAAAVLPDNAAALVMPDGWRYQADFVPAMEENRLLDVIATLPFEAAKYKEWTARRRIVSYGGRYDFSRNVLEPAEPIPQFLQSLRQQAANWGMAGSREPESRHDRGIPAQYAAGLAS